MRVDYTKTGANAFVRPTFFSFCTIITHRAPMSIAPIPSDVSVAAGSHTITHIIVH